MSFKIQPFFTSHHRETHDDLKKFGSSDPLKFESSLALPIDSQIKALESIHDLLQIHSINPKKTIFIKRQCIVNSQTIDSWVEVDRDTGYITEKVAGFSDILKFDQSTFPESDNEEISNVGYWNIKSQYIHRQPDDF